MNANLVTGKEYVKRKNISRSTFFFRLRKDRLPFFQIKGKKRKWFNLDDGIVWSKKK